MRELMSYLPENYPNSRETVVFQAALQPEVNTIWEVRDDLLAQLNPYKATWGLAYWEDALGLAADDGRTLGQRRARVVARLQGRDTTTPAVIQAVAETLLGFKVTVIEYFSEYRVELEVDSGRALPAGVPQLKERLREIMPAHLDWQLVIPTTICVPILPALGPRMARSAPPPYRAQLGAAKLGAAPLLGTRSSTVTLPIAAYHEGG